LPYKGSKEELADLLEKHRTMEINYQTSTEALQNRQKP
jgi:hypothetical protein